MNENLRNEIFQRKKETENQVKTAKKKLKKEKINLAKIQKRIAELEEEGQYLNLDGILFKYGTPQEKRRAMALKNEVLAILKTEVSDFGETKT